MVSCVRAHTFVALSWAMASNARSVETQRPAAPCREQASGESPCLAPRSLREPCIEKSVSRGGLDSHRSAQALL